MIAGDMVKTLYKHSVLTVWPREQASNTDSSTQFTEKESSPVFYEPTRRNTATSRHETSLESLTTSENRRKPHWPDLLTDSWSTRRTQRSQTTKFEQHRFSNTEGATLKTICQVETPFSEHLAAPPGSIHLLPPFGAVAVNRENLILKILLKTALNSVILYTFCFAHICGG